MLFFNYFFDTLFLTLPNILGGGGAQAPSTPPCYGPSLDNKTVHASRLKIGRRWVIDQDELFSVLQYIQDTAENISSVLLYIIHLLPVFVQNELQEAPPKTLQMFVKGHTDFSTLNIIEGRVGTCYKETLKSYQQRYDHYCCPCWVTLLV